jgi:hypothetical protein
VSLEADQHNRATTGTTATNKQRQKKLLNVVQSYQKS